MYRTGLVLALLAVSVASASAAPTYVIVRDESVEDSRGTAPFATRSGSSASPRREKTRRSTSAGSSRHRAA